MCLDAKDSLCVYGLRIECVTTFYPMDGTNPDGNNTPGSTAMPNKYTKL